MAPRPDSKSIVSAWCARARDACHEPKSRQRFERNWVLAFERRAHPVEHGLDLKTRQRAGFQGSVSSDSRPASGLNRSALQVLMCSPASRSFVTVLGFVMTRTSKSSWATMPATLESLEGL